MAKAVPSTYCCLLHSALKFEKRCNLEKLILLLQSLASKCIRQELTLCLQFFKIPPNRNARFSYILPQSSFIDIDILIFLSSNILRENPKNVFFSINHLYHLLLCTLWSFFVPSVPFSVQLLANIFSLAQYRVSYTYFLNSIQGGRRRRGPHCNAAAANTGSKEQVVSNFMMVDTGCKKMAWPRFSSFVYSAAAARVCLSVQHRI